MFFDVVNGGGSSAAQYELDLLAINKKATASAARAARSSRLAKVARVAGVKRGGSGLGKTALR